MALPLVIFSVFFLTTSASSSGVFPDHKGFKVNFFSINSIAAMAIQKMWGGNAHPPIETVEKANFAALALSDSRDQDVMEFELLCWTLMISKETYGCAIPSRENVIAIKSLKEVEAFLSAKPSEIVTLILEDYVETANGLSRVLNASGLMKYWFPLRRMPQDGQDWPLVKDMVAMNHRLIVFTSQQHKQQTEGIAYQWNYMVENQYGNRGMVKGRCPKREESAPLNDRTKSLVLVNHFRTIPIKQASCLDNSQDLINMLYTCFGEAGNRWANFVAVDFYKHGSSCRHKKFQQIQSGETVEFN
ncbi:PI-PLC X domain-containing protein [Senna tora]|uniref:PI-PLC X domain-containing protein n=1 Tax=Senna tora TaxID=362788 RepID=A0A834TSZ9_9FABA|nr:PI-PLC X domain-containing protein [Senna tora]